MDGSLTTSALATAVKPELGLAGLLTTIEGFQLKGQSAVVLELYRNWIASHPVDPALHLAQFNYGVALSNAGDIPGAIAAFKAAIAICPTFYPPYINLGGALETQGHNDQAITQWYAVANALGAVYGDSINYKRTALKRIAKMLETALITEPAEAALRASLDIDPHQREIAQHWLAIRQGLCKWPVVAPWNAMSRNDLLDAIYPLTLARLVDDPLYQLGNAYHHNRADFALPRPFTAGEWPVPETPRKARLRVGYLSSDLRSHAVGFLTAEVFELHDRGKVEVFAYYCGIKPEDPHKARIRGAVEHWIDIADMSDKDAARRIVADGIDILVDLNGYSRDARTGLFALRPAPILVNWLGYPGTMASAHHHYIIADDFIIPPEHEVYFTEKVLRLPCYQPNDRKRHIAPPKSRADEGLPAQGVVYCCFNMLAKVTPEMFERWLAIIGRVPGSVLWLLGAAEETQGRLAAVAAERGIARDRLVFAGQRPNPDHLARFALADVFLDTLPYGAHTTASDAMWMGVPVVTIAGRGFAARVCGSLVTAAGVPELVAPDLDAYVETAVALGLNEALRDRYRKRLATGRSISTLFDTPALVRRLEALYAGMYEDYANGALPRPDLRNLEAYREIGRELSESDPSALPQADYHDRYRRSLAYRHSHAALPADTRLWQSEDQPS
jgi:predicted O-linked N-acetylglucosamine transferase (SPINDLY family)